VNCDLGPVLLAPNPDLSLAPTAQESGRAGRDGLPAQSVLYYGVEDRRRMDALLAKGDRRHSRKRQQPGKTSH
jgi:superfamily II DNA helicase RecQ